MMEHACHSICKLHILHDYTAIWNSLFQSQCSCEKVHNFTVCKCTTLTSMGIVTSRAPPSMALALVAFFRRYKHIEGWRGMKRIKIHWMVCVYLRFLSKLFMDGLSFILFVSYVFFTDLGFALSCSLASSSASIRLASTRSTAYGLWTAQAWQPWLHSCAQAQELWKRLCLWILGEGEPWETK